MNTNEFVEKCKLAISGYYLREVTEEQIYLVWYCKTIQNHKCFMMTPFKKDNLMFECTWNGDAKELYVDIYDKKNKIVIPLN